MKLLIRLLQILARLVFLVFFHLIAALVRFILFPILQATLRALWSLMSIAFTATVNDPRQYTNHLAAEWTRQIIDLIGSREDIDRIFNVCRFMVGSLVVLGWIMATLFTVAVITGFLWAFHLIR